MIRNVWNLVGFIGIFALFCAQMPAFATSESGIALTNPYDVQGVDVDVTSDNAVKAREQAFTEALAKSFMQVIERLAPDPEQRAGWAIPDPVALGKMLQDFTTTNERMSPTQYAATFNMRFKPSAVRRYLHMDSAIVTPAQDAPNSFIPKEQAAFKAHEFLILPFYQHNDRLVLWAEQNPLRDALARTEHGSALAKLPMGDLDDVQIFSDTQGMKFNPAQFVTLLHKYGVDQALVIVAVPDTYRAAPVGQAGTGATVAPTKLTVMNYFASVTSPVPTYVDSSWVSMDEQNPNDDLFQKAARAVYAQVPNLAVRFAAFDQKKNGAAVLPQVVTAYASPVLPQGGRVAVPGAVQYAPMQVAFKTLTEWQNIRSRLADVPSIQSVRVKRLRAQEAQIEIVYTTSIEHVLRDIAAKGIQVDHHANMTVSSSRMNDMEPAAGDAAMYVLKLPQGMMGVEMSPGTVPMRQAM
jgi:hypothetical protein